LIAVLITDGYRVIGPTVRDDAIVLAKQFLHRPRQRPRYAALTALCERPIRSPDAIRLAEVLGRAPKRLVVFAGRSRRDRLRPRPNPGRRRLLPDLAQSVLAEFQTAPTTCMANGKGKRRR
jgi:hypothetical protein